MKRLTEVALIAASAVAIVALIAPSAGAQVHSDKAAAAHAHATPHGGEVAPAAGRYVEFKADSSGAIQVWLLDAQLQTAEPPSGATVTLMIDESNPVNLPLEVDQTSRRLVAQFDPRKFPRFQAVVSLPIDGKRQNLRFRYPQHH